MEKKTMDTLRTMICGELDDIAKKGSLSHESLDVLKDLLQSEHYINKIEKRQEEKEMEWGTDMGYSQRKYYIDADYQPYGHSYTRGRGMDGGMGNSYGRGYGRGYGYDMYDMNDMGNSYMRYDPKYDNPMYSMRGGRGYSMTGGTKAEMIEELKGMMNETTDQAVKTAISEAITKMNK